MPDSLIDNQQARIYELAEAHRAALLRGERQAAAAMARAYLAAWQRIKRETADLLAAMATARNAGEEITTEWLLRFERLQALQRQVVVELQRFAAAAEPIIVNAQWQAITAALADSAVQVQAIAEIAGLPDELNWTLLPAETLTDLVGFLGDGSPLTRLLDALGPEASAKVRAALIEGVALGSNPQAIALRVRQAFGGSLSRALTVMRTEVLRAYREATRRAYAANPAVVDGWIWNAACTTRTCPACWAMHGTFHAVTEVLDDHPNGRCSMLPHVKPLPGMGDQWQPEPGPTQFARLAIDEQDKILGRAAGTAYRAGTVTLPDFVGRSWSRDWGSMRYAKSLKQVLLDKARGK